MRDYAGLLVGGVLCTMALAVAGWPSFFFVNNSLCATPYSLEGQRLAISLIASCLMILGLTFMCKAIVFEKDDGGS